MDNRNRVACVPLTAEQILGLLNGTLKVDPSGPQLPSDAGFYIFCEPGVDDAVTRQINADGTPTKGIWLGVRASNLPPVEEGGMLPRHEVRFIPVETK